MQLRIALLGCIIVAAAGCAATDGSTDPSAATESMAEADDSDGSRGDEQPANDESGDATDAAQSEPEPLDLDDEERTAFVRLLGWDRRSNESLEHDVAGDIDLAANRQDFLIDCMTRQGFDFFPTVEATQGAAIIDPNAPYGSDEFIERYGFGVTTLLLPIHELPPELIGYDEAWLGDWVVLDFHEDPNAQYFAGLDESAQAAYEETHRDCIEQGVERFPNLEEDAREQLEDELADLDERIKADARLRDLIDEVDACMEVEGFTFTGFDEMELHLKQRTIDDGLATGGDTTEVEDLSDEEWNARFYEIQQLELVLAAEFERCIGYREWFRNWDEIAAGYQDRFLAEYAEAIALS